jgi:hypothetical protein
MITRISCVLALFERPRKLGIGGVIFERNSWKAIGCGDDNLYGIDQQAHNDLMMDRIGLTTCPLPGFEIGAPVITTSPSSSTSYLMTMSSKGRLVVERYFRMDLLKNPFE